jgi:putative DNA primase/helicase
MKKSAAEKPAIGVENIPAELRALRQWVNWKTELRDGKPTKVPYQTNGSRASSTDAATWNTFDAVLAAFNNGGQFSGIGFVFSENDPYAGVDLDKCRNKQTHETARWADDTIRELASYTELSQSFTGWHVIVRANVPEGKGNKVGQMEMYSHGRFFTMTGCILSNCGAIEERDLTDLQRRMKAGEFKFTEKAQTSAESGDESKEDWRLIGELFKETRSPDADVLEMAFREKYAERYAERQEVKGPRTGKNIIRYSIERFVAGKAKQVKALADGGKITDAGNAEIFADAHRSDLIYCFEMKSWFFWDGHRFRKDEGQRARAWMEETMRERVAEKVSSGATPKEISDALACLDTHRMTNGLREAEKKLGIPAEMLDSDKFLLTFKNGTLNLRTMEFRESRQNDFITKMVHCNYNPQAPRAARFLGILEHALRGGAANYIQKLCGYSLTGDTSEKIFNIMQGDSDTGKTTFLEVVRHALAEYAVLLQVESLMERHGGDSAMQEDLVALRGARLATTSETGKDSRLSAKTIKRICQGNGQITASAKYEKKITFPETHKLWLDSNFLPAIPADDTATWNRTNVIVFENPVPEEQQDKTLCETILREEIESVLAWMVEGERRRQTEGLRDVPAYFIEKKEEHRRRMDTLQQFLNECCESGLRERKQAVYKAYEAWIGEKHAMSAHSFTTAMREKGHKQDAARRFYLGITLVADATPEEEGK